MKVFPEINVSPEMRDKITRDTGFLEKKSAWIHKLITYQLKKADEPGLSNNLSRSALQIQFLGVLISLISQKSFLDLNRAITQASEQLLSHFFILLASQEPDTVKAAKNALIKISGARAYEDYSHLHQTNANPRRKADAIQFFTGSAIDPGEELNRLYKQAKETLRTKLYTHLKLTGYLKEGWETLTDAATSIVAAQTPGSSDVTSHNSPAR